MAKSKVAQNKEHQGWLKGCPNCGNCKFFTTDVEKIESPFGSYEKEKSKRCSIGGFAVGKSNWCKKHEFV